MEIVNWKIDDNLKKEMANHYQAKRSFEAKNIHPADIINEYTFSFGVKNFNSNSPLRLFKLVERIIGIEIYGVGVEVGSGPGTHTALLAKMNKVKKVYGVEASEGIVRNLAPVVVSYVAGKDDKKVSCVVGDFSNLELPDNSVDFVFDFFSLHHTSDLQSVIKEIYRVIKPGGFLFCFDKARDNALSNADLEKLLDTEYSPEFKKKMGVPEDIKHTRRMNGENEYRRKEWFKYIESAGFKKAEHFNLARTASRNKLLLIIKNIYSLIPPRIQAVISNVLPIKPTNNISANNRIYSGLLNNYHKEISLIIGYK